MYNLACYLAPKTGKYPDEYQRTFKKRSSSITVCCKVPKMKEPSIQAMQIQSTNKQLS